MLRIIQTGNALPFSFIVDPSSEFEPGMIAQLNVSGNTVVCGVSDGRAPIGVIDEIRTRAFTAPSWNEFVIVPATGVPGPNGQLVTPIDVLVPLKNPNVIQSSFTSSISLVLTARNGLVTFPAGTPLNFDAIGSGQPNAIRAVVNYRYQIPNIIGDDSTIGAGRIAVWFQRFIGETDVYETNQVYPLNANLFVSELGLLTTRQVTPHHPAVALCIAPPSPVNGTLQYLWL
jgi:hypothetical protein